MACGIAACVGSYLLPSGALSLIVGFAGIAAVLGGFVILLRRRDYRELRSQYGQPDALSLRGAAGKRKHLTLEFSPSSPGRSCDYFSTGSTRP